MSVPTPIVALFYLWLLASVAILIYRRVTKKRVRPTVVRAADTDRALRTDWAPPPPATDRAEGPTPTGVPSEDPTGGAARTPPPATTPSRPVAAPGPPGGAGALPPAATLIEALAGIAMPCDLLPLTTVEGRSLSDRELLLSTSGHAPDDVGTAFASALEALGYTITPMGPVTVLATRGPDRITVVLHDRPFDELSGKRSAFPTTKPGDVVLELRL